MPTDLVTNLRTLAHTRLEERLRESTQASNELRSKLVTNGQINNSRAQLPIIEVWRAALTSYRVDLLSIWTEHMTGMLPRLDDAERSACVEGTLASFDAGWNNIHQRLQRAFQQTSWAHQVPNAWQQLQPDYESNKRSLLADIEMRLRAVDAPALKAHSDGTSHHRLAAVVFGDIVGSSKLMADDESGFVIARDHLLIAVGECAARHGGRKVKDMGDGFLLEFTSAVDAMSAVLEIHRRSSFQLRVGLNVCDVVVSGEDILGDGVNIAQRLEAHASAGKICLPRHVAEDLQSKLRLTWDDRGIAALKNVRAIHVVEVNPLAHRAPDSKPPDTPTP